MSVLTRLLFAQRARCRAAGRADGTDRDGTMETCSLIGLRKKDLFFSVRCGGKVRAGKELTSDFVQIGGSHA